MQKHTPDQFEGLLVLTFQTPREFAAWLTTHPESKTIWLRMYKKATGILSITYDEALDIALCYGWIDSQVKKYDEQSYVQKFGPRQSRSPWSDMNKKHVARLIKAGKMQKAGLAAIQAAKKNGLWGSSYGSPSTMIPSPEFQKALDTNLKAKEFFETLSKTQKFYFIYWIKTAKRPETKEKRLKEAIAMLERREKRY